MKVTEFLDKAHAGYQLSHHRPTFTAQQMAAEEHVPGMMVAKPVVIKADDKFVMCVLPACCKIDFDALKSHLSAKKIELADESEMAELFPDCVLGAEPPFGDFYGLPTIIDRTMLQDEEIIFQSGTHDESVKMNMDEYIKLAKPRIMNFCYHTH